MELSDPKYYFFLELSKLSSWDLQRKFWLDLPHLLDVHWPTTHRWNCSPVSLFFSYLLSLFPLVIHLYINLSFFHSPLSFLHPPIYLNLPFFSFNCMHLHTPLISLSFLLCSLSFYIHLYSVFFIPLSFLPMFTSLFTHTYSCMYIVPTYKISLTI